MSTSGTKTSIRWTLEHPCRPLPLSPAAKRGAVDATGVAPRRAMIPRQLRTPRDTAPCLAAFALAQSSRGDASVRGPTLRKRAVPNLTRPPMQLVRAGQSQY
jgi:hypothetical protein